MGTIDRAAYTLTCPSCGRSETVEVRDTGNGWNGAGWGLPKFEQFDATVTGGGRHDPVVAGVCGGCGTTATVVGRYV